MRGAVRLMDPLATLQRVTVPISAKSPCCFVGGAFVLPLSVFPLARPMGLCNSLSLCSIYLDVIVLALHLEQSVNLQP